MLAPWGDAAPAAWAGRFRYAEPFRPRFAETDALGHVSNTAYATYVELGRLRYLRAIGDATPERAFAFQHVIAELAIRYLAACYHDEALAVRVRAAGLGRSSLVLEYAITAEQEAADLRAVAQTTVVSFDGHTTAPWSAAQRTALAAFEGDNLRLISAP